MSEPQFIKGDRGVAGERGEHGDHGQDGRQGPQGEPGVVGVQGKRGANLKGTDRRLVIIFAYVTVAMVLMFSLLTHQQHKADDKSRRFQNQLTYQQQKSDEQNRLFQNQIAAGCVLINQTNAKINLILAQNARNVRNTTGLTAAQKAQAIKNAASFHLPITECPPRR